MNKKVKFSGLWTAILSVVSVAYIFPILLRSRRIKCSQVWKTM